MSDFLIFKVPKNSGFPNYSFLVSQNEKAYKWIKRADKPDHWFRLKRVADSLYCPPDLLEIIKQEITDSGLTWTEKEEEI